MKGTTILLLGAATLVAYTSAHPYSRIPDGSLLEDGYHYKKSSSNSNSNSYSQSNQNDADISGSFRGQAFSGTKTSGYSTSGGSHSQSSNYASGSFNGNLPLGLPSGERLVALSANNDGINFDQFGAGSPGNPGTAGLGLGDNGAGSSYASSGSSAGVKGAKASQSSVVSTTQTPDAIGSFGSGIIQGFQNAGKPFEQATNQFGSTFAQISSTQIPFTSGPAGGQQFWWNGDNSPFQLGGKPTGSVSVTKGTSGILGTNQGSQVLTNGYSGNPFLANAAGNAGSFASSGSSGSSGNSGSFGTAQTGGSDGVVLINNARPGSGNPFFNGEYAIGAQAPDTKLNVGSVSFANSKADASATGNGNIFNPFLNPSGFSTTELPQLFGSSTPGSDIIGNFNPFLNSGSGQGQQNVFSTGLPFSTAIPNVPTSFESASQFFKPDQIISGFTNFGSVIGGQSGNAAATAKDYQQGQVGQQIDQVAVFPGQSTIVPGVSYQTVSYSTTPVPFVTQGQSIDDGFTVSCSGPGKICVLKSLCVNGLATTYNRNGLQQLGNRPQLCKVGREVCCSLPGISGFPSGSQGSSGSAESYEQSVQQQSGNYGVKKPASGNFVGGNSFASANANANANAAASSKATFGATKNTGSYAQQTNPSDGGLFGSANDNSGEDLSSGEPGSLQGPKGYLPPLGSEPSDQVPAFSKPPVKGDSNAGSQIVPNVKVPPRRPTTSPPARFPPAPEVPVQIGCAAALICVEEQFCTLEGTISPEPVALSSEQILRRVPLSSCKNPDNGVIGKCCRDPNYVDPWPMGNLPADYAGGFDEQGFPKYLNIGKTRPPSPTPGIKGSSSRNTNTIVTSPRPAQKQFQLPSFPNIQDFGNIFQNPFNLATQPPQGTPGVEKPSEGSSNDEQSPSESGSTPGTPTPAPGNPFVGFFENIQKPIQTFVNNNNFTIPTFPQISPPSLPTFENPFSGFTNPISEGFTNFQNQLPFGSGSQSTGGTQEPQPPTPASPGAERTIYDSASSNQSPTFIPPHTPGLRCGLRNKVQRPRGLSKDDVAFGEIPWQAMILSTADRKLLCSGAIVAPNAVLTTAHCVDGLRPNEVSIKAGEWKLGYELKHEEPLPFEIVAVQNIVQHPGYKSNSPSHNLAILFLEHPITLDQHVDVICIGDRPQPHLDRQCIATGWGKTVLQVNIAGSLMHSIDVDLLPQDQCRQRVNGAESRIEVDNTVICAKARKQSNNMCQVDVGGPLACDQGNGFYELTGLYSQDTGCLPTNQVATFALIDTEWVKQTLASPPPLRKGIYQTPNLVVEATSQSSVKGIFAPQLKTEPKCDCQKSNLPPNSNRYLPPV